MAFTEWIARMEPPEAHVTAIRSLLQGASETVKAGLAVEPDGSFSFDVLAIEAL